MTKAFLFRYRIWSCRRKEFQAKKESSETSSVHSWPILSKCLLEHFMWFIYTACCQTACWVWVCILYSKNWFPQDTIIQRVVTFKYTWVFQRASQKLHLYQQSLFSFHFLIFTQVIFLGVRLLGSTRGPTHKAISNLNMGNDSPFSSLLHGARLY